MQPDVSQDGPLHFYFHQRDSQVFQVSLVDRAIYWSANPGFRLMSCQVKFFLLQKFPLFSFCNENPMKRSIVEWGLISWSLIPILWTEFLSREQWERLCYSSDAAYAEISNMLKQFEQFELKTITKDDYGFSTSTMRMQRFNRARTMLRSNLHLYFLLSRSWKFQDGFLKNVGKK